MCIGLQASCRVCARSALAPRAQAAIGRGGSRTPKIVALSRPSTPCRLENKVSLGFVEGLNNKIRVIQRRAYGLRNEEYLRLKILTCMLPELQHVGASIHLPDCGVQPVPSRPIISRTSASNLAVDMMDNASALPTCPTTTTAKAADDHTRLDPLDRAMRLSP